MELKSAFENVRAKFAETIEQRFHHSVPLFNSELAQPEFGEMLQAFAVQNSTFPINRPLAELWALGDSGELILASLITSLRQWSGRYLLQSELPQSERATTGIVRLITIGEMTNLNLADVDKRGRNMPRTNPVTVAKARAEAQRQAGAQESGLIKFALSFLQANCVFDQQLTKQARARRVESINAVTHYSSGDRLVSQGDLITTQVKRALDELRARVEVDRLAAIATGQQAEAVSQAALARQASALVESTQQANRLLLSGLSVACAGCVLLVILAWRRRKNHRLEKGAEALVPFNSNEQDGNLIPWRERAVAAEVRAQNVTALLRSNLFSHWARWMMNEFVQRLLVQRSAIQTSQQHAQREVADLARRLAEMQAPLEQRLRAYECRIADLEFELAGRSEQNAELIRAKIETTRKQLEGERQQQPSNWN